MIHPLDGFVGFCWILLVDFLHPSIMNYRCVFYVKKNRGGDLLIIKMQKKNVRCVFSFNLGGDFVVMNFMANKIDGCRKNSVVVICLW